MVSAMCSCYVPRAFKHIYLSFDLRLGDDPKNVPNSLVTICFINFDQEHKRAFFRMTHTDLHESSEEWVEVGGYFGSAWWLGSRGLRLIDVRDKQATLEKFGKDP